MTRQSRIKIRNQKKRRLTTLVIIALFTIVCVAWLSINHKLLIPYLITNPKKSEQPSQQNRNVRGTIYDRSYKELAESLERVSIYALPREINTITETAASLAPLLGRSKNELALMLNNEALRIWLARDISQKTEESIRKLKLTGIFLGKEIIRTYPHKETFAHLLGYVDKDMGLAGIEWHYNNLLGRFGVPHDQHDFVSKNELKQKKEKSGFHLVLTIDLKIQKMLESFINGLIVNRKNVQIAACVMEMSSGALVASANYPSFDPGRFSEYDKKILENILLQPIAVPDTIRRYFKDASLLQNQFAGSSDPLPWSVIPESLDLGSQIRLWERLALSSSLKLDFAKDDAEHMEKKPFLPVTAPADYGAVPEVATPFQILTGISHLLNNGKSIVPYILERVIERDSKDEYPFTRKNEQVKAKRVNGDFSQEMRRLLAIQAGKGELSSHFLIGKQLSYMKIDQGHQYVKHKILLAILPADKSDLIFMVVVKEPSNNPIKSKVLGFADLKRGINRIIPSVVALQEVMKFNRDMMEISNKEEMNFQLVHVGEYKGNRSAPRTRIRINSGEFKMPDLLGLSLRKSLRLLQNKNVTIKIKGFGRVVEQFPSAGTALENNKECRLVLQSDYSLKSLDDKEANR